MIQRAQHPCLARCVHILRSTMNTVAARSTMQTRGQTPTHDTCTLSPISPRHIRTSSDCAPGRIVRCICLMATSMLFDLRRASRTLPWEPAAPGDSPQCRHRARRAGNATQHLPRPRVRTVSKSDGLNGSPSSQTTKLWLRMPLSMARQTPSVNGATTSATAAKTAARHAPRAMPSHNHHDNKGNSPPATRAASHSVTGGATKRW